MTPEDDANDDALTREYQRASAAEAGRPATATRAAILAEARALAQRRVRADRDPRVPWALAASVAVIGIAVLLWRQVGLQPQAVTASAPTLSPPPVLEQTPVDTMPSTEAESSKQSPSLALPDGMPLSAATKRELRPESGVMNAMPPSPPQGLPASPAPAANAPVFAKAEGGLSRDAVSGAAASVRLESAARASTPPVVNTDVAATFRQQFPTENASESPPHTLWVLRNESGAVLRSGSLEDGATLQRLVIDLQRDFPDRAIGPWVLTPLVTDRGIPVELALATLKD